MIEPHDAEDDRLYCDRCLHHLDDEDLQSMGDDPGEPHDCPYCKRTIERTLTHEQMRTERAIQRADWDRAREDGLIG